MPSRGPGYVDLDRAMAPARLDRSRRRRRRAWRAEITSGRTRGSRPLWELQRSPGEGELTLQIEAEALVGLQCRRLLVHHNTKQLKFTPGSTGSSD
jgi:hypothetical protein